MRLARSKPCLDFNRLLLAVFSDQNKAVAEQVGACVRVDQLFIGDIVHPVQVGGNEDVSRGCIFDLLCQRAACRVGSNGFLAAFRGPGGVGRIKPILEACGGEDSYLFGGCDRRRKRCCAKPDGRDRGGCQFHPVAAALHNLFSPGSKYLDEYNGV